MQLYWRNHTSCKIWGPRWGGTCGPPPKKKCKQTRHTSGLSGVAFISFPLSLTCGVPVPFLWSPVTSCCLLSTLSYFSMVNPNSLFLTLLSKTSIIRIKNSYCIHLYNNSLKILTSFMVMIIIIIIVLIITKVLARNAISRQYKLHVKLLSQSQVTTVTMFTNTHTHVGV